MRGVSFGRYSCRQVGFSFVILFNIIFIYSWNRKPGFSNSVSEKNRLNLLITVSTKPDHEKAWKKATAAASMAKNITVEQEESKHNVLLSKHSSYVNLDNNFTTLSHNVSGCNYGKGRWVPDGRRPLYTGFKCKRWLSKAWNCRLSTRQDFSYEAFRWQPDNCNIPEFKATTFLRKMQDKTIAFVGDSLGRQQFQSLMCMITASGGDGRGPKVEAVGPNYGLPKSPNIPRAKGSAFRFPKTNTTILFYWSTCLCEIQPLANTNSSAHYAMHLDRPVTFLRKNLRKFDILVLNTGHHWNRGKLRENRWVMHVNGQLNRNKELMNIGNAKNYTIYSIIQWLDSKLDQNPHLKVFYRSISPRHFVNGDWDTGGSCDNTIPLLRGNRVLEEESRDQIAKTSVKGTRIKFLDITSLSQLRNEGHVSIYGSTSRSFYDCLHWCLPGIPDTWNKILLAQL